MDTILNDSPKDIVAILRKAEQDFYARQEQQSKSRARTCETNAGYAISAWKKFGHIEDEQKRLDREKDVYIADQSNATKLQVQEIANYFKAPSTDDNQNGVPDPMEIAGHALKTQEINMKHYLESQKWIMICQLRIKNLLLKRMKVRINLRLRIKKIEQIKIQNDNQIELANKKQL